MNEAAAREVLMLQAFETAHPASPNWSDDDRAWATRLALQEGSVDAPTFITHRAQHAMQRLAPREPGAAKWLARRLWQWRWVGWAVLAGVMVGVLADKVYEVTEISQADVQVTPRVGMHWNPEFIRFITKWREEFVIVPNMERILS